MSRSPKQKKQRKLRSRKTSRPRRMLSSSEIIKKCGRKAFLMPNSMKFLVYDPKTCKPSSRYLQENYDDAKDFKNYYVIKKAKSFAKKHGIKLR